MQTSKDKETLLNEYINSLEEEEIKDILMRGLKFSFSPDILVYVKKQNLIQGYLEMGNKHYPFQITFHYNPRDDEYMIVTEVGKIFSIRKVKEVDEL